MAREMIWHSVPLPKTMPERYVYAPRGTPGEQLTAGTTFVRIFKYRPSQNKWVVRMPSKGATKWSDTEPLPEGLTLEEMKALAIAMWRLR